MNIAEISLVWLIQRLPATFDVTDFNANRGLGLKFCGRAFGYVKETDYHFGCTTFHPLALLDGIDRPEGVIWSLKPKSF